MPLKKQRALAYNFTFPLTSELGGVEGKPAPLSPFTPEKEK
jgi:hypothetical protein